MNAIEFDQGRHLDLILLGRAAIDLNPVDYYMTLAESTTFKKYVGGSPANIAAGLSRLGKKCGFLGRVSDDRFGDFVTDFFKSEGIDTSRMRRCANGEKLGLTFTEILSPSESSILMYRNGAADLALDVGDIDEEYVKSAKALLISGTALCESPSREAAFKAIFLARRANTPIVFDIDYRKYNWKSKDEMSIYYWMAAREAAIILGSREEYDIAEALAAPGMDDARSAAYWHGMNAKIVVIKHGRKGSAAYAPGGGRYSIRPFPVNALKGFGGGDGYASAFLYGVFEGLDLAECLELGSASASLLVASHGCAPNMPALGALREFIADSKKRHGDMVAMDD